jgi:hypothetical protein
VAKLALRCTDCQPPGAVGSDQHPIYKPTLRRSVQDKLTSVMALFETSIWKAHAAFTRGAAGPQFPINCAEIASVSLPRVLMNPDGVMDWGWKLRCLAGGIGGEFWPTNPLLHLEMTSGFQ